MNTTNYSLHSAIAIIVLFITAVAFSSCSTLRQFQSTLLPTSDFFRVDNLPKGDQTALPGVLGATSFFKDKTIEKKFTVSYDKTWNAMKRVAMKFESLSKEKIAGGIFSNRPVIILDKEKGVIQIGKIEEPGKMGRLEGSGRFQDRTSEGYSWADEFHLKLIEISPNECKVEVNRKVVVGVPKKIGPSGASFEDELVERPSNCNYERWVLTQIEDDVTGKLKRESIAIVQLRPSKPPTKTFVYIPKKFNNISEGSLGIGKYIFTINGAVFTHASIFSTIFDDLSTESQTYMNMLFASYRDSIRSTLARIVEAKGFQIVGSFDSIDQMTYPQKQRASLILTCNITLSVQEVYINNSLVKGQIKKDTVQDSLLPSVFNGKLSISGQILFELFEPFSQEKMWSKSVAIVTNDGEFSYKVQFPGEEYFGEDFEIKDFVSGEDTRADCLSKMLSSNYEGAFDKVLDILDIDELTTILKLANDLRIKRKY